MLNRFSIILIALAVAIYLIPDRWWKALNTTPVPKTFVYQDHEYLKFRHSICHKANCTNQNCLGVQYLGAIYAKMVLHPLEDKDYFKNQQ